MGLNILLESIAGLCTPKSGTDHQCKGKIRITEYFFQVPRDWTRSEIHAKQTVSLFARSAERVELPADPASSASNGSSAEGKPKSLPWCLYLQGGPGFGCSSPQDASWTQTMLERGYKVLHLDQRGTGLSSPLSASTLAMQGDEQAQAQYLRSFRADSIVKDCEAVRCALTADLPTDKQKWSIMGQSFGGFCALTYLSFAPEGLREVFLFGGLPPLADQPDEVYRRLYPRVEQRNEAYYAKYPEDVTRVQQICNFLQNKTDENKVQDSYLTARRFMQLGLLFGGHGGIDTVHDCVLRAHSDITLFGHITRPSAVRIANMLSFDEAIIYAILHEPIYCQGKASRWSASRMMESAHQRFVIPKDEGKEPIYFTGEMIYPWMFDDYEELAHIKEQAEIVQNMDDWPALYDKRQLANNEVPVYAAAYYDDMYVDFDLSMETARSIRGCKTYVTNAMYHNAIRAKTDEVLKALFALRDDTID